MRPAALLYFFLISSIVFCQINEIGEGSQTPAKAIQHGNYFFGEDSVEGESGGNDSGLYELRKPSEELMIQLKKDKDLNYDEEEGPSNLFEFISLWIREQIQRLFLSKGFEIFQEYLSYIIAAAALIIVIFILKRNKLSGIIYGVKDENLSNFREIHDDINKIDFDALIASSMAKKDYRIAARYHYLKCLKHLSDKKIIDWQIHKTNKQYMQEIANPELKKSFRELTFLFEWFWYGDYPLNESIYFRAQNSFIDFNNRLAVSK